MDTNSLRKVMGQFATGVTVITTTFEGTKYGFTANSYTSVSLKPAMVLFCLDKKSEGYEYFKQGKCFAVNFLSKKQEEVSNRFANFRLDAEARFADLELQTDFSGSPILKDSLGWIDCNLVKIVDGGDHWIFLGEVKSAFAGEENDPLLYFQGKYRSLLANE